MSQETKQTEQEYTKSSEPMVPSSTKPKKEEEKQASETPAPKKLTQEEELVQELAQHKEKLLRLAAEYENYKKISEREQIKRLKYANEGLVTSLLPIIDNLEQAIRLGKKAEHKETKDLVLGVEMVFKQLLEVLRKFEVEIFSADGQKFNPERHEAVGEKEHSDVEAGTVIEEYQKGYLLAGRLLRPSRVIVSKKPEEKK